MHAIKCYLFAVFIVANCFSIKAQTNNAKAPFKLFFEKTYLHTDRDVYAAGDTVWLKAYLVNAQNNMLIGTSNNLYVELISPKAEMVSRQVIRLDNGLGNADISLADSIPSGKYRLRAYTNWMRNFGDNFIFEKYITILNIGNDKEDTIITAKDVNARGDKKIENSAPQSATNIFFPEGGSLIEGVGAIIAIKSPYRSHNGIDGNGGGYQRE